METQFHDGMKLAAIYWPHENLTLHASEDQTITVEMQNGQMAPQPWATVRRSDGRVFLHNLALVESVEILTKASPK